jgi:hypothetical protein
MWTLEVGNSKRYPRQREWSKGRKFGLHANSVRRLKHGVLPFLRYRFLFTRQYSRSFSMKKLEPLKTAANPVKMIKTPYPLP